MVLYHFFVSFELPYNYSNMLVGLDVLNFKFMPNMVASLVPTTFESAVTPAYFTGMIDSTTFFISSGQYLFLLLCYASWAILISILKNKGVNKWRKLRKFAKGVFERRVRFGAIQESLWFCYMSFVFFGLWQMK
jgi:hypothetical protein